jgi:hypothetical protein
MRDASCPQRLAENATANPSFSKALTTKSTKEFRRIVRWSRPMTATSRDPDHFFSAAGSVEEVDRMTERIETVLIGAGQRGPAMSYGISRAKRLSTRNYATTAKLYAGSTDG